MKKLTAKNYLATISNKTKLKDLVVLTTHDWIVKDLTRKEAKFWPANSSLIYKEKNYDIVLCLPGASMTMITLEEMISSGVKKIVYVGTGAGLKNQSSGSLLVNPRAISVLNPYEEQEIIDWNKVKKKDTEVVDMESEYLQKLAETKKIELLIYLIITDHVSKNNWRPLKINKKYKDNYKTSLKRIKKYLKEDGVKRLE